MPGAKCDTEQGRDAHRMKLLIHGRWIRPSSRIEIQIALLRHVQEVHDEDVQRQVALAIPLRNSHELVLGGIDRLALDVAVGGLRQHVRDSGELAITLVNFVGIVARNHKKRNAVSHLRRPHILQVEPQIDCSFRRVVPDQAVIPAGHHEGNANSLSSERVVIMPAVDATVAEIEKTLLMLAHAVVVLTGRGVEDGGNTVSGIGFLSVFCASGGALRTVGNHDPAPHGQQRLAGSRCYRDRVIEGRSHPARTIAEVVLSQGLIQLIEWQTVRRRRGPRSNTDDHPSRANDFVSARILLAGPASH